MLSILAVVTAVAGPLPPMSSDTPPPLPVPAERLSELKTDADIIAASRLADGSTVPSQLILPVIRNTREVVKYMVEHYPPTLRDRYDFEMPWAWVFVDDEGRPARSRIVKSSGRADFDSLAIGALRVARFGPASVRGVPVGVWVPMPIEMRTGA